MGEGKDTKDEPPKRGLKSDIFNHVRQQVEQWAKDQLIEGIETPFGKVQKSQTEGTSIRLPNTPFGQIELQKSRTETSLSLPGTLNFSRSEGVLSFTLPEIADFKRSPGGFSLIVSDRIDFRRSADGFSLVLPHIQSGSFSLTKSSNDGISLNLTEGTFGSLDLKRGPDRSALRLTNTPFGFFGFERSKTDGVSLNLSDSPLGELRLRRLPGRETTFNLIENQLGNFHLETLQRGISVAWDNTPVGISLSFTRLPTGQESLRLQDTLSGSTLEIGRNPLDPYGNRLELRNSELAVGAQLRETPSGAALKIEGSPSLIIPALLTAVDIDVRNLAWPLTLEGRNGLGSYEIQVGPQASSVNLTTNAAGWRFFTKYEKHVPPDKLFHDPLRSADLSFGAESGNTRIEVTKSTTEGPRLLLTRQLGPGEQFLLHANQHQGGVEAMIGRWSFGARSDFGTNTTFNLMRRLAPFEADLHFNFSRGRKKNHYDGGLQIRITPGNK